MEIFVALTSADGYATLLSGLQGDPREDALFLVTLGPRLPFFLKPLVNWLFRFVLGDEHMATLEAVSKTKTVQETQRWLKAKQDYTLEWRREVFGKLGLDGIICPNQATPALPHGATWNLSPVAIATILYNVLELPAGVVPVTRVDPAQDALPSDFLSRGPPGSAIIEKRLYAGPAALYNAEKLAGLPVGVQVVGAGFEDEKVLYIMDIVDRALKDVGEAKFGPGQYVQFFGEKIAGV